jgi:hypothetical protein
VFSWRDGHLEAQFTGAPPRIKPSVFEQDGPGRFHVVSGRERGERLEVVRDGSGAVVKLYWATYPITTSHSSPGRRATNRPFPPCG